MIIKSLLFIIILIFIYETFQKLNKLKEEYFTNTEPFIKLYDSSNNNKNKDEINQLNDIAKTISINCKNPNYPDNKNMIMAYEPPAPDDLDTPEYSRYKPLEYDSKRKYYFRRDILIPEGYRRAEDDQKEIDIVQSKYDAENDPLKKQILQDELDLFKWRSNYKNITKTRINSTEEERSMRDIISDYYPFEIGMSRIWREPHSHIPDYSKELNYGYKPYKYDKYNPIDLDNNLKRTNRKLWEIKQKLCSSSCIYK